MTRNRLRKEDTCRTMKEMSHLHMLAIRITNSCVTAWWQSAQTGPVSLCNDLSCQTVTNGPISAERRVHQSLRCGTRCPGPETVCFKPLHRNPGLGGCRDVHITARCVRTAGILQQSYVVTWCSLADGIRYKFLILVSDSVNGIASDDILYYPSILLRYIWLHSSDIRRAVLVCEFPCFDVQMVERSAFQCHNN